MRSGKASKTALRVAIRRAAHQLMENPRILEDPIALPLLGGGHARDMERAMHPVARDFRAFMAARSRFAEDRLQEAVRAGVGQYAILGAGLDTFAYRNPSSTLRVFEVDFPATQEWKREMLTEAGIHMPENLTYVPLDFEHKGLREGLAEAGLDLAAPAFFTWLGVTPYLTRAAFRATLEAIAAMPAGSGVCFDYALSPESLSPVRRAIFDRLAQRVAAAGEPLQLFFAPEEMDRELRRAGLQRAEQLGTMELNALYFDGREDGLRLSTADLGRLVVAWVGAATAR
jgi:methyltransferase (TIGR00027 family)